MMATALGPPEVIAQLENAAKVLMVSAPPRPSLRATRDFPTPDPSAPMARLGAQGEAAWGRSTGVSCCWTPNLALSW